MRVTIVCNRFMNEGTFVDSMSAHSSDTMQFGNMCFPSPKTDAD